ncbi:MAG: pentapeptide repeat-containing protein [Halanaerobiales bacterium]|nr:pentapeptide repeat-containing protein [Halanaerobiales bacterium]
MTDIQLSRKSTKIQDLPSNGTLLLVSDQQQDKITISDVNISASSFLRLGMLKAVIENSHLTQSQFEDSYFRKAEFRNVQFTGSNFRFCNFDKASFQACDFKYCTFYQCKLPADEIIACMPVEPNLRRDLARNLRSNSEMIGDKKTADRFLDIEIQASEDLSKAIFLSSTKYYKDNYNFIDQVREGLKYLGSKVSGLIWGYGHRVGRLLISYITVTVLCSFLTYFGEIEFFVGNQKQPRPLLFWESIYMGFGETIGAINLSLTPVTIAGKLVLLSASFLGTLFLALLAATFYRRIAR